MRKPRPSDPQRLRQLLQRGDPLLHEGMPASAEFERLRQRLASAARPSVRQAPRLGWLVPVAATLALLIYGASQLDQHVEPLPRPADSLRQATPTTPPTDAGSSTPTDPRPRQVQFTAPGGTRIYWTLLPRSTT